MVRTTERVGDTSRQDESTTTKKPIATPDDDEKTENAQYTLKAKGKKIDDDVIRAARRQSSHVDALSFKSSAKRIKEGDTVIRQTEKTSARGSAKTLNERDSAVKQSEDGQSSYRSGKLPKIVKDQKGKTKIEDMDIM